MGTVTIRLLTNTDPRFYPLLGPFLSRREIVAELGASVWDEDGKQWLVALVEGKVAGFCAWRTQGETTILCSDYVAPAHRGKRIFDRLFRERLKYIGKRKLRATATPKGVGTFRRYGFAEVRQQGRYTVFEQEVADGA